MKILVTGANGYIGHGVVKQLIDDGVDCIATDYQLDGVDNRAQKFECDLFSIKNPFLFFGKPDAVLHLAWRDGFQHNASSHIEDLPFHYKFVKSLLSDGLSQIAIMGTMHEIGFFEGGIRAETPTNPLSLYGIAKNALRSTTLLIAEEQHAICQWIRAFYIVGNSTNGSSIFAKIAKASEEGKKLFPFTMGMNQWDFIDYEELCIQVSSVIEQQTKHGIINVCSGYPERLSSRVERFIRDNQYDIKLEYGAFPDRPYDSKAVWGDDTIIRDILKARITRS